MLEEKRIEVLYRKVTELKPYQNNPRNNEEAVEPVAASIRECGFLVPIVIDKNGVIVAGDVRLKAAIRLGIDEAPCVLADHLNEEQTAYFRLVDNRSAEFATWNAALEAEELAKIVNLDLDVFHFPDFSADLDVNDENFFKDAETAHNRVSKTVSCPKCGHEFTP